MDNTTENTTANKMEKTLMESKEIIRARALVRALGFGCTVLVATSAFAQSEPQKVEKIEVTGSSIKRIEGETALPVTVISRQEIEKTGATTPMELLNLISSNNTFGNISIGNVIGSTTFSAQTASLRGLGGGRTLVLINGKRLDGFAGEVNGVQGVDLSVIPFTAIERVEVLFRLTSGRYDVREKSRSFWSSGFWWS